MSKLSGMRSFCAVALLALVGCVTPAPWVVKGPEPRSWGKVVASSTVLLGRTPIDNGTRQISTYVVTVILERDGTPEQLSARREAYRIDYDNDAYDVVTPLSAVEVPHSVQVTYLVVRTSRLGDNGPPPPPPPSK